MFLLLIVIGLLILYRRKLDWALLIRRNVWILVFFSYAVLSVLWSDFPFIAFKRWFKASGNVIMALILLTERNPRQAIGIVFRRLAFLLLPLSILFIKYFPSLGRSYHMGRPLFSGVATQKNGLGQLCLILGIYFFWGLFHRNRVQAKQRRETRVLIYLTVLPMLFWLLDKSDSATSLGALLLAIAIMFIGRLRSMRQDPQRILKLGIAAVLIFVLLEAAFDVTGFIIQSLGRDATLTTRVPMWEVLISSAENPLFGSGYESFWLGSRLSVLFGLFGVMQAHNGYLELYLSLGIMGLALFLAGIIAGVVMLKSRLKEDYSFALLRLTFIAVVVIYNWTEATFYGVSNMWMLLYLGILDVSYRGKDGTAGPAGTFPAGRSEIAA